MVTVPESYERSRARFRSRLDSLTTRWPSGRLSEIVHAPGLTTDILQAEPTGEKQRLLVLSTGLHGIEGYLGSAVLELFFEEFLPQLNPQTTGLLLIHAINPWGMKNWKRTNPANVDLNRNFIDDDFARLRTSNPDYPALSDYFNPQGKLSSLARANTHFMSHTLHKLATLGARRVREAALMGQYHNSGGIYFGGTSLQPETVALMALYRQAFHGYGEILHFDLHTGYGPRDQMTLVTSPNEKMSGVEIRSRFNAPRVASANPDEFYTMQGDMIDWEYRLVEREFPGAKFFGAACEFGTYGESTLQAARSLRITILKNQANQHGVSPVAAGWVENEYRELYLPSAPDWLAKALADARQMLMTVR